MSIPCEVSLSTLYPYMKIERYPTFFYMYIVDGEYDRTQTKRLIKMLTNNY